MSDYDLEGFLRHLATLPAAVEAAEHRGLEVGAELVEREAKDLIGQEVDGAAGPFSPWMPLSGATMEGFHHPDAGWIKGKIDLGYTGQVSDQDPLLRTGELRASITHKVEGHEAVVGSEDPVAVYQEFGTPSARYPIPPRSFLGRAAFTKAESVVNQLGIRVAWALRGLLRND